MNAGGAGVRSASPRSLRFIVPWRPDGGWRDALWDFCWPRWPFKITFGRSPEGPFSRSAAINDGARGDWDVAVIVDADIFADPAQVQVAAEKALETGRLTLGFTEYVGLLRRETEGLLAGRDVQIRGLRRKQHESSLVAVPRSLWDEIGGFDERFNGWGQEDVAFCQAARVLGGEIERVPGTVIHLWHPLAREKDRHSETWRANQALGRVYRNTTEPEAMRQLVTERQPNRKAVFYDIYRSNRWNGRGGTRSGPGSSLVATERLRNVLPELCRDLDIGSVLDAACGDSLWMPPLPNYVGVDVVAEAVQVAKRRHRERVYAVADICTDVLPRCEAIICRDAMQHMSLEDGLSALENFRASGATWLFATSYQGQENKSIETGGYYQINLSAYPFSLGEPELVIRDGDWESHEQYPHKILGIWAL